jgi:hypothetical protein
MKRGRPTTMIRGAIWSQWVDEVCECIEEISGDRPPRASVLSSLIDALREDDERAHSVNITAACH